MITTSTHRVYLNFPRTEINTVESLMQGTCVAVVPLVDWPPGPGVQHVIWALHTPKDRQIKECGTFTETDRQSPARLDRYITFKERVTVLHDKLNYRKCFGLPLLFRCNILKSGSLPNLNLCTLDSTISDRSARAVRFVNKQPNNHATKYLWP